MHQIWNKNFKNKEIIGDKKRFHWNSVKVASNFQTNPSEI